MRSGWAKKSESVTQRYLSFHFNSLNFPNVEKRYFLSLFITADITYTNTATEFYFALLSSTLLNIALNFFT